MTPVTAARSPSELADLIGSDRQHAVVDVRDTGEYRLGHIHHTATLPLGLLDLRRASATPDRSVEVVAVSGHGQRAELAAAQMVSSGWTDVSILEGGLAAWVAEGRPVMEGWGVEGKEFGERLATGREFERLTVEELAAELEAADPPLLFDVRTGAEFERSHIPGARSAPLSAPPGLAGQLRESGTRVVVHCAGRTRSFLAMWYLSMLDVPAAGLENGTSDQCPRRGRLSARPHPRFGQRRTHPAAVLRRGDRGDQEPAGRPRR